MLNTSYRIHNITLTQAKKLVSEYGPYDKLEGLSLKPSFLRKTVSAYHPESKVFITEYRLPEESIKNMSVNSHFITEGYVSVRMPVSLSLIRLC